MKFIKSLAILFFLATFDSFVNCYKNDTYSSYTRDRHKHVHSYHNIVVRNINSTNGLLPYFGIYRAVYQIDGDKILPITECDPPPSAIEDFPGTIFPEELLRKGAVIFHFLAAIYFLSLLAIVCGHYFIPSVECICEDLHLSRDVAAATFMATATTMPEFFTNTISTFVTESDLGIGAIIGSMLFNTLGVSGCAALAARKPISLDWFPVTRDSVLYAINIILLVIFAYDGVIWWYEAMVFVILYFAYFTIMFQNKRIMKFFKYLVEDKMGCFSQRVMEVEPVTPAGAMENNDIKVTVNNNTDTKSVEAQGHINVAFVFSSETLRANEPPTADPEKLEEPFHAHMPIVAPHVIEDEIEEDMSLWHVSRESKTMTVWWYYTWPLRLLCACLIPNPKRYRKLYPLTFIMCMIVLAANSYMVVWMVTVIGYTFTIPEAVMGLTFLAAGGCLPEAASAIIMARKGEGAMGVSNALGSNSLAVLFSLGLPWFLRTIVNKFTGKDPTFTIASNGIEFTIMILLVSVMALYFIIACNRYRLKRIVGGALLFVYTIMVTFGILLNMGIIFKFITEGDCPEGVGKI